MRMAEANVKYSKIQPTEQQVDNPGQDRDLIRDIITWLCSAS